MFKTVVLAAAMVTSVFTFAPSAHAALSQAQKTAIDAKKGNKDLLVSLTSGMVANAGATDAQKQMAIDIVAYLAPSYPRIAILLVGQFSAGNKAAAPAIAAAAAGANQNIAVPAARAAAAAAPAYASQTINQVSVVAPCQLALITAAVNYASTAGELEQQTLINNPIDNSTSAK